MGGKRRRGHSRNAEPDGYVRIWGLNPVMEFLDRAPESLVDISILPSFGRKKRQKSLLALAESRGIAFNVMSDFNRMGLPDGAVPQGVCALARPDWEVSLHDIHKAWGSKVPLVVVCDEISDPGNLGAIIRSSAAFGVHAVMISERNSASVNGTVIKACAGTIVHLRVCSVRNSARAIATLQENGLWAVALAAGQSMPVWDADLKVPLALVLGAEGKGLRHVVMKQCDTRLHIPQAKGVESLNVAAACTAALYETVRQRASFV